MLFNHALGGNMSKVLIFSFILRSIGQVHAGEVDFIGFNMTDREQSGLRRQMESVAPDADLQLRLQPRGTKYRGLISVDYMITRKKYPIQVPAQASMSSMPRKQHSGELSRISRSNPRRWLNQRLYFGNIKLIPLFSISPSSVSLSS